MKTAKIESYRLTFVSYRFATEIIGIESFCNANSYYYKTTYLCIVFSNFRKKKMKRRGLITFPFHIATLGLSINARESLCLLIYIHNNTCFP